MKERVAKAMFDVWINRSVEICRSVEFGGATNHCRHHFVKFARVEGEPDKIVGLFHAKIVGPGDVEIISDAHYHPPMRRERLNPAYQQLMHGFDRKAAMVFIDMRQFEETN
jgi:hypothetical protein